MRIVLKKVLQRLVTDGKLSVRWPDGKTEVFGGRNPGKEAAVAFRDSKTLRRLVLNPELTLGECYMDGGLSLINGTDIRTLLELLGENAQKNAFAHPALQVTEVTGNLLRRFNQFNPMSHSRRNVAHHYDLNGNLYRLFLDNDRQYSCAYFQTGDETLDEAQAAKKRHIAAKLYLDRPGLTVLDIGCGWGGLGLTLARDYGAKVTGITLSTEQLEVARARAKAAGLEDRVNFILEDYRKLNQKFDRIVSVGMFEHVGVPNYKEFFSVVNRSLKDDGLMVLHSIGRYDGPSSTGSWFLKYIFPGGYSPALSEVMRPVEKSGLIVGDIEILRLHYAKTLHHWQVRFEQKREEILRLYDERFCRMFEFYLAASEMAFRYKGHMNFQIQLLKKQTSAPLTRDYISENEALSAAEKKAGLAVGFPDL